MYLIAEHEDFYHHEDLAAMFVPPLVPLVRFGLRVATLACKMNVRLFAALGCWTRSIKPEEGEGGWSVVAEDEELTSRGNRKKGGKDD